MVTHQAIVRCMHRHACVAAIALGYLAAGAANKSWRKAAPIQEEQRLSAPGEILFDGPDHDLTKTIVRLGGRDIHESQQRWRRIAGACWQDEVLVRTAVAALQRLQRWRGGPEYDWHLQVFGASDSQVSRGVLEALLLFQ